MDKNDGSAKSGSAAQGTVSSIGTTGFGNMVAPGSGGSANISRDAFEANTKAYFDNLHAKEKAKSGSAAQGTVSSIGTTGFGNMVAPGSGGSANISRDAFEANTKAYFDNLHAKEKKAANK